MSFETKKLPLFQLRLSVHPNHLNRKSEEFLRVKNLLRTQPYKLVVHEISTDMYEASRIEDNVLIAAAFELGLKDLMCEVIPYGPTTNTVSSSDFDVGDIQ